MSNKIAIIGAGIAGLSAGIHACRNGYDAEIYENHNLPGGLCTAWSRNGYTFDGCIHWLVGTKAGSQFNRLWREVTDMDSLKIIDHEIFLTIEDLKGKTVHIYSNLDRLEEHLCEEFPGDEEMILELINAARVMAGMEFPVDKPDELLRFWDMPLLLLKMMPLFKIMGRYTRVSLAEYLGKIKDPLLRESLLSLMPGGYAMTALISTLASSHTGDAGFPRGGSLNFARSLEKRFLDLGGTIHYNSRVKGITVASDKAVGITLADDSKVEADLVISAADLYHTVFELLKGRYITALIRDSFKNLPTYSSVQVSLGVASDLSAEDHRLALKLEKPIILGGEENRHLYLTNYSFDPQMAPPGKSVVAATLYSGFDYWQGAYKNRELYCEKKKQLADQVINLVEKRFPVAKGNIEVVDIATPYTYHRYTGVYRGAYMGWIVPPDEGRFTIPRELPGLKNFYLAGQWISPPAGLPGSMLSGRQAVQLICSRDKKPFRKG